MVHVSLNPDESILDTFDAFCVGEREKPTLELAQQLERGDSPIGIANLWIKKGKALRVNRLCQPDRYNLSIFYPYPGTDLYKICSQRGILPSDFLSAGKERIKAVLNFSDFSKKHIQKALLWFDYYVFQGLKPTRWLADEILKRYILSCI